MGNCAFEDRGGGYFVSMLGYSWEGKGRGGGGGFGYIRCKGHKAHWQTPADSHYIYKQNNVYAQLLLLAISIFYQKKTEKKRGGVELIIIKKPKTNCYLLRTRTSHPTGPIRRPIKPRRHQQTRECKDEYRRQLHRPDKYRPPRSRVVYEKTL